MAEYQTCPYHGRFRMTEANDYQCPKCQKEIMGYGRYKRTGVIDKYAKGLINRAKRL